MNLIEAKITAMFALGLGSFFMGIIPAILTKYSRNKCPLFLSTLLCFGAGVLLATSMVHMLPEVKQALGKYSSYAELMFCGGFFLLYCIDEIVHIFKGRSHGTTINTENEVLVQRRYSAEGHNCYGAIKSDVTVKQPAYNPNFVNYNSTNEMFIEAQPSTSSGSENIHLQYKPSQLCHIGHLEPCRTSKTGSISLLIALTLHAVIEGLAIGLEDSTPQVLLMLLAVALHKLVVGFSFGTELLSEGQIKPCLYVVSISMFAFGSSLGIGLGMGIVDVSVKLPELLIPTLQAMAGGTLLYVTVSEILPRERAQWHQEHNQKAAGLVQFLAVLIGFVGLSALTKCLDVN